MDPLSSAGAKVKGFAKSSQDFVCGLFRPGDPSRRNPIEILKRLQREAFSDLMKLRDRQEKVERIIALYKSSKGGPFQEASTRVSGKIDVLGAILLMENVDQESFDALRKAGVKPGLRSKFVFETSLRENDSLVAELEAAFGGEGHRSDASGSQLSLAKVLYKAEITDCFSAIAIPVGAYFKDIGAAAGTSHQARGFAHVFAHGPPLLSRYNGSAIGLTFMKPNILASLAQSISNLEIDPGSDAIGHCFSTFGQVICKMPKGVNLSLLGCHRVPKLSNNLHPYGAIAVPLGFLRNRTSPESTAEPSAPPMEINSLNLVSSGSVALKLDSEIDECTRIGGWVEIQNSNPKHVQWAVSVSDNSEDEVGWGMSVGGTVDGARNQDQFQVESHLKFKLGNRFSLSPGFTYSANGNGRTVALVLRSNWSL